MAMGEMGKDFCPNFLQPFLENIDKRSCDAGRSFQYFATLFENADPLPGAPCRGAFFGRVEREGGKQVRVNS